MMILWAGLLAGCNSGASGPAAGDVAAQGEQKPSATSAPAESPAATRSPPEPSATPQPPEPSTSPAEPEPAVWPPDPPLPTYPPEDDDVASYAVHDLAANAEWQQRYQDALASQEPWLRDPVAVARAWMGEPEQDMPCTKGRFHTLPNAEGKTILIAIVCAGDDTISAVKLRFELSEQDGLWKLDWLGVVRKCGRPPPATPSPWKNMECP